MCRRCSCRCVGHRVARRPPTRPTAIAENVNIWRCGVASAAQNRTDVLRAHHGECFPSNQNRKVGKDNPRLLVRQGQQGAPERYGQAGYPRRAQREGFQTHIALCHYNSLAFGQQRKEHETHDVRRKISQGYDTNKHKPVACAPKIHTKQIRYAPQNKTPT